MKRLTSIAWARFRRWWYLLFLGMWRGECATEYRSETGALQAIASGLLREGPRISNERVWWREET